MNLLRALLQMGIPYPSASQLPLHIALALLGCNERLENTHTAPPSKNAPFQSGTTYTSKVRRHSKK